MQNDPSRIDYNNQDNLYPNQNPLVNQPQYKTENVYQSHSEPSPCTQYVQQSISGTSYTPSTAQHHDQIPPHQQQDALIIPTHRLMMKNRILTTITSKLRAFFIISGIIYSLWGGSAIGLEIALIMYSSSTYYRGIWVGNTMLATGFYMLIIACRVSHSMVYIRQLLAFILIFCITGVCLSGFDLSITDGCDNQLGEYLCDREIAQKLKVIIMIILSAAIIYTGINLVIIMFVQKKSASKPPAASALSGQH